MINVFSFLERKLRVDLITTQVLLQSKTLGIAILLNQLEDLKNED